MPRDIFSALAKYSEGNEENYLTEAFVFLVKSLLERERLIALDILTRLCAKNDELRFDRGENVSVLTQQTIEQGRLDIKVSTPSKLIYIEVKDYSAVNPEQLKRYRKDLDSSSVPARQLILLTRFPTDFSEHLGIPDKHVRWFQVHSLLENTKAQDPVAVYLVESFKSFLEANSMSIQKVSEEYVKGVPAFNNLINMIEVAINNARLSFYQGYPRAAAWESRGFWLEDKYFWCGIHYSTPLVVTFEMADKTKFKATLLDKPSLEIREGKVRMWFRLQLEDINFFSLDKDRQLEEITKFVKTAHAEAQQMRIK